ncbi:MAG: hypothetical protein HY544_03120 [Candidatus Diapherotrites archaeon]|uniref:Uncharacterized protein n=1 Tax=Candidatus Iainarchaeum sp. TaxID=3101447 RepID=A0A8T3YQN9_9ARCH|nr:hypothetical protein [Candidatus Diapherotrites archaeon]
MQPGKLTLIAVGTGCALAALVLLSFAGAALGFLKEASLFSEASPIGIFAVFLAVVFAGTYFFKAAGHIIKETIK